MHGMREAPPRLVADLLYERAAVLLPTKRVVALVQSDVEHAQRAFTNNIKPHRDGTNRKDRAKSVTTGATAGSI